MPLAEGTHAHAHATSELDKAQLERVYRYVFVNVQDVDAAEDITSETLLAAVERLPWFKGESSLSAWLMGIARHKIADYFRKHRSQVDLAAVVDVPANDPSPAEVAEMQAQLDQITMVIHTLTQERADALNLHFFGQLSVEEVAHILGKKPAAIRMLIYRAVRDIRERLSEE
jgi:RNA polymerase sigma-70 factor, ECF subfamily